MIDEGRGLQGGRRGLVEQLHRIVQGHLGGLLFRLCVIDRPVRDEPCSEALRWACTAPTAAQF